MPTFANKSSIFTIDSVVLLLLLAALPFLSFRVTTDDGITWEEEEEAEVVGMDNPKKADPVRDISSKRTDAV